MILGRAIVHTSRSPLVRQALSTSRNAVKHRKVHTGPREETMDKSFKKTNSRSNNPAKGPASTSQDDSVTDKPPNRPFFHRTVARCYSHDTSASDFKREKENYLKMTLEDKRRVYKCRKHVVLEDVPDWSKFFDDHQERLHKMYRRKRYTKRAETNTELNKKVSIWKGDITSLEIDSIANAANNSLMGGGGVDGAIHSAAGSNLVKECMTLDGCATGDAKITGGYKLPAKYVIHTVGPIGEHEDNLRSCYERCLTVMKENNLRSVAFPCISTGIYGYPNGKAAHVAIGTVREWLEKDGNADQVDRIIFCLFMPQDVAFYEELMQEYFPVGDETDSIKTSSDKDIKSAMKSSKEPKSENTQEDSSPSPKRKPPSPRDKSSSTRDDEHLFTTKL